MDKFASLKAFVLTIDNNGFTAAAKKLGVATSSVTRLVDNLENSLNTKLIIRSTRSIKITASGEVLYKQANQILNDLKLAEDIVKDLDSEVKGSLKISIPVALGRICIMPRVIIKFMKSYPNVMIESIFTDDILDMNEHDLDFSIRIGDLPKNGNLIPVRLLNQNRYLVATEKYLERHGVPDSPDILINHHCLAYDYNTVDDIWLFRDNDSRTKPVEVKLKPRFRSNNSEALLSAVLNDLGIALLPGWLVTEHIEKGNVVNLFKSFNVTPNGMNTAVYLIFPENRRPMKKIRAFIDFAKDALKDIK